MSTLTHDINAIDSDISDRVDILLAQREQALRILNAAKTAVSEQISAWHENDRLAGGQRAAVEQRLAQAQAARTALGVIDLELDEMRTQLGEAVSANNAQQMFTLDPADPQPPTPGDHGVRANARARRSRPPATQLTAVLSA